MKLNKKYSLTIFTVLGIQAVFGFNFANAYCENEIEAICNNSYNRALQGRYPICISDLQKDVNENIRIYSHRKKEEIQEWINKEQKYMTPKSTDEQSIGIARGWAKTICVYKAAISTNQAGNNANSQVSQSDNSVSNTSSSSDATINQQSQQNSTPEDIERNNVKSYSAQQTAAYQEKNKGRGKKHNVDAYVNQCIKTKGRKILNTCSFDIEVNFCAENPDPSSKNAFEMADAFDCAKDSIGMWTIKANFALMGVFTADSVSVFACKKPYYPFAEYDHQKKTLVGRCGEL